MQKYTLKLLIVFKIVYFAVLAQGKSRFSRFPLKKFYNIGFSGSYDDKVVDLTTKL